MVGQDLTGLRVLDAFGGSGLLGLEAWSRGAEVTVVERQRAAARAIRERGHELGALAPRFIVHHGDVHAVIDAMPRFDGVLADPPYAAGLGAVLPIARHRPRWMVFEAPKSLVVPDRVEGLTRVRHRGFGDTVLHVFRWVEEAE